MKPREFYMLIGAVKYRDTGLREARCYPTFEEAQTWYRVTPNFQSGEIELIRVKEIPLGRPSGCKRGSQGDSPRKTRRKGHVSRARFAAGRGTNKKGRNK